MILNSEGNNIFQVSCGDFFFVCHELELIFLTKSLSPEDYRYVMNVVESAILSTDLAMYFKKRDKFLELIDNGEFDWQSDEKKERELIENLVSQLPCHRKTFPNSFVWDDDDSLRCK